MFNPQSGRLNEKDFLLYYYYGGMVYTALKKYDKALYYFEVVCKGLRPYHIANVNCVKGFLFQIIYYIDLKKTLYVNFFFFKFQTDIYLQKTYISMLNE